jgi:hypothetical protein
MLLLLTNFAVASPTTENNNLLMLAHLATPGTQTTAKIVQHADTRLILTPGLLLLAVKS